MSALSASGISIRKFAERDGCTDKVVRRAIASGKLKAFPDGTLDPQLVGTSWRQGNRRAIDPAKSFQEDPPRVSAPVRTADNTPDPINEGLRDLEQFIRTLLEGGFHSEAIAIAVKENGLALKHMLAALQQANSMIDIAAAETILFETFRSMRDSWLNWPSRIGPMLATDLGLEPATVTEALNAYVHKQLEDLGSEPPSLSFAPG